MEDNMNYNQNSPEMERLLREHASAKKKMILGIVFTAVGSFLSLVFLMLLGGI
jgi:hypothetical protein